MIAVGVSGQDGDLKFAGRITVPPRASGIPLPDSHPTSDWDGHPQSENPVTKFLVAMARGTLSMDSRDEDRIPIAGSPLDAKNPA